MLNKFGSIRSHGFVIANASSWLVRIVIRRYWLPISTQISKTSGHLNQIEQQNNSPLSTFQPCVGKKRGWHLTSFPTFEWVRTDTPPPARHPTKEQSSNQGRSIHGGLSSNNDPFFQQCAFVFQRYLYMKHCNTHFQSAINALSSAHRISLRRA